RPHVDELGGGVAVVGVVEGAAQEPGGQREEVVAVAARDVAGVVAVGDVVHEGLDTSGGLVVGGRAEAPRELLEVVVAGATSKQVGARPPVELVAPGS